MSKFKVGDKVRVLTNAGVPQTYFSKEALKEPMVVKEVRCGSFGDYSVKGSSGHCQSVGEAYMELWDKPKESNTSDGGPASYYDFKSGWVTLNDMLEDKAVNQWGSLSLHFKDLSKALFRFGGKDGTSKEYDVNKMIYSALRAKVMLKGKQEVREMLEQLLADPQFK